MSMGEALDDSLEMLDFTKDKEKALKKVIEERNKIVHHYFKENFFFENYYNDIFVNEQVAFLSAKLAEMRSMFSALRKQFVTEGE